MPPSSVSCQETQNHPINQTPFKPRKEEQIKLGPFKVDHPFILAPMAGITNSPFRRLMRNYESALVISELISANGIEHMGRRTLDLLKFHESERFIGLQIFGENQENLVQATRYVERLGADFVDLNLGCPVPKVVKKGAGSAMCRDLPLLYRVLSAMVKSVAIPVTIKIRTGWDAQSVNAHEVVKVATEAGVAWVAIHGRTRAQGYSGEADWELIGEVKAKSPIPIIGNGDVNTPQVAVKRLRESGVDAVMIGRGALRNPFLFQQARDLFAGNEAFQPKMEDYLELLKKQRGYLEAHFNERLSLLHAKKFLSWYAAGFPHCHEFRKQVFQTHDPEVLWNDAISFFKERIHQRSMTFLNQPFLMGGHG